jgi:hypothetical protein
MNLWEVVSNLGAILVGSLFVLAILLIAVLAVAAIRYPFVAKQRTDDHPAGRSHLRATK